MKLLVRLSAAILLFHTSVIAQISSAPNVPWKSSDSDKEFASRLAGMPADQAKQAILAAPQAELTVGAAFQLREIGNTFINTKPAVSLQLYQEAEEIARQTKDERLLAAITFNIGSALRIGGNSEEALIALNKSLALYAKLPPFPADSAKVHNMRSSMRMDIGNLDGAEEDGKTALNEYDAARDEVGMARSLNSLGNIELAMGHFTKARENFERGLGLARKNNQRIGEAYLLNNIANSYLQQENAELALPYCLQAIKIKEEVGNREDLVNSLANLARVYQHSNRPADVKLAIDRAMTIANDVGEPALMARVLEVRGTIEIDGGDKETALNDLKEALVYVRKGGDRNNEFEIVVMIAQLELDKGQADMALQDAQSVLVYGKTAGLPKLVQASQTIIGKAAWKQGRAGDAHAAYSDAIDSFEMMREEAAGGAAATAEFFSHHIDIYQELVGLDASQNNWEEAFHTSEREKARSLLDLLSGGRATFGSNLTPEEQSAEQSLHEKINALDKEHANAALSSHPDTNKLAGLDAELKAARSELRLFNEKMYAAHPDLSRRRGHANPITLPQTVTLLPDTKTALLEYEITRDATYLFVITRDGVDPVLHSYALPLSEKSLDLRIHHFQTTMSSRDPDFAAESTSLYRALILPASKDLVGRHSLVIVPSGSLWHLPFQALRDTHGKFLIEEHAFSFVPSLSVLHAYRANTDTKLESQSLVAFGDPAKNLPEMTRMVNSISAMYDPGHTNVFLHNAATLKQFQKAIPLARDGELLLATHGVYDDQSPLNSYLLMASESADGQGKVEPLDAAAITELQIDADLVVLSACETAEGQYRAGDGLIGLGWSFLAAGGKSTLASQWRVESYSTTQLMIAFHHALSHHIAPAEALRQAEIAVLHNPQYKHPFYWAPFVLLGN
jgi:CHAT domain-containing protein